MTPPDPRPKPRPIRTLLLTRPRDQSEAFAAALEAALPGRFRPVIAPMLRIEPTAGPIDLDGAQALLFTSANGVATFAALSPDRRLPAFCVGDMTARAARAAGFSARSAGGDVAALAALAAAEARPNGGDLLHVRGRHAAGELTGRLAAAGLPARALEIYDQRAVPIDDAARALLETRGIDVLAAFSPRSAASFAEAARREGWDLAAAVLVSLSAAADAAHAAPEPGRRVRAAEPTRAGMMAALAAL